MESSVREYVDRLVAVFGELRRVLRTDGMLIVDIGDTYASTGGHTSGDNAGRAGRSNNAARSEMKGAKDAKLDGQLLGVPWRLAFALQDAGWCLRQDCAWIKSISGAIQKGSVMPETVSGWSWRRCRVKVAEARCGDGKPMRRDPSRGDIAPSLHVNEPAIWQDCPGCEKCLPNNGWVLRRGRWRFTRSWEYLFLFANGDRYYADAAAVAEPGTDSNGHDTHNPRSAIFIPSSGTKLSHFATFSPNLPALFIRAFTSEHGVCCHCGSPYARMIEKHRKPTRPGTDSKVTKLHAAHESRGDIDPGTNWRSSTLSGEVGSRDPQRHCTETESVGWRASCTCPLSEAVPATVIDPFCGISGTGVACARLGRNYIGIDLSEKYTRIAAKRLRKLGELFHKVEVHQ